MRHGSSSPAWSSRTIITPTPTGSLFTGLKLSLVLGLLLWASQPVTVAAEFSCRIKKTLRGGMDMAYRVTNVGDYHYRFGTSSASHIYVTVASASCTSDASAMSGRLRGLPALGCSGAQTSLPASTLEGNGLLGPRVVLNLSTLGSNLVDGQFFCYGTSGTMRGGDGEPSCSSAPDGLPALLAPASTPCADAAAYLNAVIGNSVDFYCDGYVPFLQLRDCAAKIGAVNAFAFWSAPAGQPPSLQGPANDTATAEVTSRLDSLEASHAATSALLAATRALLAEHQICGAQGKLYGNATGCVEPATTECARPACGEGTQAHGGECIPDCASLRRRDVDCHPFCDVENDTDPCGSTTCVRECDGECGWDGDLDRCVQGAYTSALELQTGAGCVPPTTNQASTEGADSSDGAPVWYIAIGLGVASIGIGVAVLVLRKLRASQRQPGADPTYAIVSDVSPPPVPPSPRPVVMLPNDTHHSPEPGGDPTRPGGHPLPTEQTSSPARASNMRPNAMYHSTGMVPNAMHAAARMHPNTTAGQSNV